MDLEGIEISNVTKRYLDTRGDAFTALNEVSLSWRPKENLAVIGESGSGKSTLARLIAGLEKPTEGIIKIEGKDIAQWDFRRWRRERKHIQAVFQDASGTMNPAYSVYRNIEEALLNLTELSRSQRKKRIYELLDMVNISPELLKTPVRQLSGGEQRRLSLIRALSIHPEYLILDEVTSGLDLLSSDAVLSVLEKYHKESGCAYLMITHDKQNAYRISDRILEMQKGKIVRMGERTEIKAKAEKKCS
ncbi:peptide/nickel transport system ATP-binding protein [Ruminiclostridium sufflavum DSM 19573]|uniref:Peptide/nickel transport system ATP-binding protein n=1 Tax=Ruminiclostridium sufflavum DSM 19573 TaxID=1121337 RepID=A0A318XQA2_9FIRM|nr:dipeptide/oligopeptide/nickel ABC transporter ATP-binding protein [Ruminiclostridium sufflavum]PYG90255.1 peptide/nickel transport system ATP-binding protein [Ruminiclostridium sufflavum DSM 19573]